MHTGWRKWDVHKVFYILLDLMYPGEHEMTYEVIHQMYKKACNYPLNVGDAHQLEWPDFAGMKAKEDVKLSTRTNKPMTGVEIVRLI